MTNDAHSWPLIAIMLAVIIAIVAGASMLANFVLWMFT
jgi:hypothetical protein